MLSSTEQDKLRALVWNDISLRRVKGMIEAHLEGKKNCTQNWIYGQITKAHNLDEARIVIYAFDTDLGAIDPEKFAQLRNRLGI